MRAPTTYAGLVLTILFAVCALLAEPSSPTPEPGRKACANCHAAIYKSYKNTAMARASGFAKNGLIAGDFLHSPSGVRYRVFERGGRIWLSYERDSEPGLHGQRELLYFIGSDKKGRSYLFPVQGFLFESPINWYAQETRWNMAPPIWTRAKFR